MFMIGFNFIVFYKIKWSVDLYILVFKLESRSCLLDLLFEHGPEKGASLKSSWRVVGVVL